jgi:hypothetical protein
VVSRCPVTTAVIMAWMVSSRSADSGEPYVSCRMHCSLPTHFRDSGQVAAPAGCLLLLSTPVLMRRVLPFAKNAPVHVSFLREIANRARRAARPGLSRGTHSRFLGVAKTWMAGRRRAEATPSFRRLCPAMTAATFLTRRANHVSDYQKWRRLSSPGLKNIPKIIVAQQGKSLP